MSDLDPNTLPAIGHNSGTRHPIIDLPDALDWVKIYSDQFSARRDELLLGFARWATIVISDDVIQGKSADFVKQISETIKQIEAARTEVKAPVLDLSRTIDGAFRAQIDPLASAKATIEQAMTTYARKKAAEEHAAAQARAAELLRQQQEAAELAAAEAEMNGETPPETPQEPAQAALPTVAEASRVHGDHGTTASLRGRWTYEVENLAEVPRHMLMLNDAAVKAAIKAGERKIPGIRVFQETKIGVR